MTDEKHHSVMMVYITCSDIDEARKIGYALVEEHLAACVNLLGPATSIYDWDGKLEEASEVVMIAKTVTERVNSLVKRVMEIHSYDVPCVVTIQVTGGNPEFLKWVMEEAGEL